MARGRHDPCVVPRAVPMVEAMVALVMADHLLQVRPRNPIADIAYYPGLGTRDARCLPPVSLDCETVG